MLLNRHIRCLLVPGERFTLNLEGDVKVYVTHVALERWGYNLASGAWSLYEIGPGAEQAWFLRCKQYRKRKITTFNMSVITSITAGWVS